jgi:NtrC-family two-component system sensor histidine kinase KinB
MSALAVVLVALWTLSPLLWLLVAGPLVIMVLYARRMSGLLERLRELDRLKDEFVATASHELRTPLASVYGAATTLSTLRLSHEKQDALLAIIASEAQRLAGIIDDILLVNQLESRRVETLVEACDGRDLLARAVEAARVRAPENISLRLSCPPTLPPVTADAGRVAQVLANLLENAVKYSPDGGRIDVAAVETSGAVRFSVADQGLGIPAAEQERIFEKFHRLDPNMTRGVGGTGLGLYLCRELVRRMNGNISVSSQPGIGTTFSFDLPVCDAALSSASTPIDEARQWPAGTQPAPQAVLAI